MGLRADIVKSRYGDCSNGGISGRASQVTIVNIDGPFDPSDDAPAVMLIEGHGANGGTVRIVPCDHVHGDVWIEHGEPHSVGPMMGGTYIATSDSRFTRAVEALTGARFYGAVAFHDRYETVKQYAEMI